MPACCASAGVGQIVTHHRRCAAAPPAAAPGARAGARDQVPGRRRPARWCWRARRSGRWHRRASTSASSIGATPSSCDPARGGRSRPPGPAARRAAAATPRARARARCSATRQLLRERGRLDQDLLPAAHLEAPVARAGAANASADRSWRLQLREVLATCARRRVADELPLVSAGHPVAPEQLLLPVDPQPGDRPRHRQPLEQQLGRALPGVLPVQSTGEGRARTRRARSASASRAARARCPRGRCRSSSERCRGRDLLPPARRSACAHAFPCALGLLAQARGRHRGD